MTTEEKPEDKKKFELDKCVSKAKTTSIKAVAFPGKDGKEPSRLYAVGLEFLEGPNLGKTASYLMNTKNTEFFSKTLVTIGWIGPPQSVTQIAVGKEIRVTVDEDINPANGERKMKVKFLNPIDDGTFGMAKYAMSDEEAKAFDREVNTVLFAYAKTTGMKFGTSAKPGTTAAPSNGATKPAPQGQTESGIVGDDNDIPF